MAAVVHSSCPRPAACCSGLIQRRAQPALQPWHRQPRQRPLVAAAAPEQAAAAAAATQRPPVPVTFLIGGNEITVEATPGQNLWDVAKDAGADITLGCSQGSCGVCEVEVWKYSGSGSGSGGGSGSGSPPSVGVVRACIAGVPPGYARLEVREVPADDIWGVDGFDT